MMNTVNAAFVTDLLLDDGRHIGHREGCACCAGRGGDFIDVGITWYISKTTTTTADAVTHGCPALLRHALFRSRTNQPIVRGHDVTDDDTTGACCLPSSRCVLFSVMTNYLLFCTPPPSPPATRSTHHRHRRRHRNFQLALSNHVWLDRLLGECRSGDREVAGSSLTHCTAQWPGGKGKGKGI